MHTCVIGGDGWMSVRARACVGFFFFLGGGCVRACVSVWHNLCRYSLEAYNHVLLAFDSMYPMHA